MNKIIVEVSIGELLDKISILEIKQEKIKDTEKLNRALCLKDLTSIKDLNERFKKSDLTKNLDIVNIAKLYKHC